MNSTRSHERRMLRSATAPRMPLSVWTDVNAAESDRVAGLLDLDRARETRKYRCPVHGGSDSLHAYPGAGKGFYCFAEQCKYSNVDLAAAAWGVEPAEACARLADLLGIIVPDAGRRWSRPLPAGRRSRPKTRSAAPHKERKAAESKSPPNAVLRELKALRDEGRVPAPPTSIYRELVASLQLTDRGRDYLSGRALDADEAAQYGFRSIDGPADWRRLYDALGASYLPVEMALAGLYRVADGRDDLVPARPWGGRVPALVIPYLHRGDVVGVRFRAINADTKPKYHTLPGITLPLPFNADALEGIAGETVFVVEGELNAYTLRLYGLRAVGLAGAGAWRDEWASLVESAARVVALYDADDAGMAGARKLVTALQKTLGRCWIDERGVLYRLKEDANELHMTNRLREVIDHVRI